MTIKLMIILRDLPTLRSRCMTLHQPLISTSDSLTILSSNGTILQCAAQKANTCLSESTMGISFKPSHSGNENYHQAIMLL